jgi:acetyltransferase-like isoleucine patch superfamily enzyme
MDYHYRMLSNMVNSLINSFLLFVGFDKLVDLTLRTRTNLRLMRYSKQGININFIQQGGYELMIAGDLSKFSIHHTSHLKSSTFIECSGGVTIGRFFHVGRGLTIYSSKHDYTNAHKIPYDEVIVFGPVKIDDFVWIGANVTILPGVSIGEGAIVGAGTLVTKDVAPLAVVGGNPAQVIGFRDKDYFNKLKAENMFF